jgi:GGDEF domain-containing protein
MKHALVIFDGLLPPEVPIVLERLSRALVRWNTEQHVVSYEMGASCGIAYFSPGKALAEVVHEADQQMFQAKGSACLGVPVAWKMGPPPPLAAAANSAAPAP